MTADDLVGKTFAGRFTITSRIGEGGMATVYRAIRKRSAPAEPKEPNETPAPDGGASAKAEDSATAAPPASPIGDGGDGETEEIALKIMNAALAADSAFVKRFRREAKAASRLHHPSVVAIYDHGVEDGLPYIAMELIQGAELVSILHHERRLPEARAARIVAEMLSALAAAHELGIVHRDLKPENVMICRDPKDPSIELVKVLDFGIAKLVEPEVKPSGGEDDEPPSSRAVLTMAGTVVGTPEYMSPEQSRGAPVDARSDIYSCGVILYQLVTGRVPFAGSTYFETALMHVHDVPRPPREIAPDINPKLEALILKALSKAPEERPQTAREMQTRLLELMPELSTERPKSVPPEAARPAAGASIDHARANEARPVAGPEPPPAAGRSDQPVPKVVPPGPDSDDARTRVLPAAAERSGRPVLASAPEDAFAPTLPGDGLVPEEVAKARAAVPLAAPSRPHSSNPVGKRKKRPPAPMGPLAALAVGIGLGAVVVLIGIVVAVVMR